MSEPIHELESSVEELLGIGRERARQLARLKILTVADLLFHKPRRYEDRRGWRRVSEVRAGEAALIRGRIVAMGLKTFRKKTRSVFELIVDDGTARLHARWWNLPFMQNYFQQGDEVFVYGKVCQLKPRAMDHPETEVIETGADSSIHINRLVPIYPLTEGLPQRWMRSLLWRVVNAWADRLPELHPTLPRSDLIKRGAALRLLHFPTEMPEVTQARERLALDEFVDLQVALQRRRQKLRTLGKALPCRGDNRLIKPFLHTLGFELTEAQKSVLRELRADLGGSQPMRRLLQGDVGSGKTVVAACAALMALESGYNVLLMAPTEILAEQHYATFRRWFEPLGIVVMIHSGARKTTADEPDLLTQAAGASASRGEEGLRKLVVGTHALFQQGFRLDQLGLVVIDEQHKFGVTQREELLRKGHYPHLLAMTATPIPRTLGLTLYGDLDISVIRELPGGRGRIRTFVRTPDTLPRVWEFMKKQLVAGRQAYVVYPRLEDTGPTEVKAVLREADRLSRELAPHRLGVIHGRLKAAEKDRLMDAFRRRDLQVLVATSVIEVGLDIPNASVMLIENAEQFGLAQLHQLRGRIGRGAHDSYCILVAGAKTVAAQERLQVLAQTQDGFKIAEEDLRLRGPGEFLGADQSGVPSFRFANLLDDGELLERARREASILLQAALSTQSTGQKGVTSRGHS